MNMGVENGDVSGGNCYMSRYTRYESKNHNSIYHIKKIDEISTKRSEIENNRLQDSVDIDVILSASKLNQYNNME